MRIRDPGCKQFGFGIRDGKKSDPGSGSATLESIILNGQSKLQGIPRNAINMGFSLDAQMVYL
jgi:hypothetical protein